jgi:subtilisin family serine protease
MRALIVHLAPPGAGPPRPGTQGAILRSLAELQRAGHVRRVRSLWIANAVAMSADASGVAAVRARRDVRSIEADAILPIHLEAIPAASGVAATGAPALWSGGVDGRGIVVATLDSGVDLTRGDLASHYRGGANSWFDASGLHESPVDLMGHGSQVMQLMTGGGGVGMAPGARFIAARIYDDAGTPRVSYVHDAIQWLLDPDHNPATDDAPDVLDASWGSLLHACDTEFQPDLQALRAAGILPVFAAGNDGPAAQSDNSPANLPEAFAVGATAGPLDIASFSSIGPSSCDGAQFPALVAPGTGIVGFGPVPLEGTSFSAPHVAGALALLLQIAPGLSADAQAALLTQSARDLGVPGVDDTFGAGALDIEAAARLVSPALDLVSPVMSGAVHSGTTLRARADDALSAIDAAEWWDGTDPGPGAGTPMAPADGSFDSAGESLVAATDSLSPGPHVLGMRARDAAGNWSAVTDLAIHEPPLTTDLKVTTLPLTAPRAKLALVASDGFEHGLRAWSRRVGLVATPLAAAMTGRRGFRATSAAGAPALVSRELPRAGDEVELTFRFAPGTFSSAGAWVQLAAITSASGRALACVELRTTTGGQSQVRLSASKGGGASVRSLPQFVRRRGALVVLSLSPGHAALTVDSVAVHRIARGTHTPPAGGIALGLVHAGPRSSSGALEMDDVFVREASAAP